MCYSVTFGVIVAILHIRCDGWIAWWSVWARVFSILVSWRRNANHIRNTVRIIIADNIDQVSSLIGILRLHRAMMIPWLILIAALVLVSPFTSSSSFMSSIGMLYPLSAILPFKGFHLTYPVLSKQFDFFRYKLHNILNRLLLKSLESSIDILFQIQRLLWCIGIAVLKNTAQLEKFDRLQAFETAFLNAINFFTFLLQIRLMHIYQLLVCFVFL